VDGQGFESATISHTPNAVVALKNTRRALRAARSAVTSLLKKVVIKRSAARSPANVTARQKNPPQETLSGLDATPIWVNCKREIMVGATGLEPVTSAV